MGTHSAPVPAVFGNTARYKVSCQPVSLVGVGIGGGDRHLEVRVPLGKRLIRWKPDNFPRGVSVT